MAAQLRRKLGHTSSTALWAAYVARSSPVRASHRCTGCACMQLVITGRMNRLASAGTWLLLERGATSRLT